MTTVSLRPSSAARRATALACDLFGNGTPLLLIHSISNSGAMFAPLLPALSATHRLLVPDLRGHGRSHCLGAPTSVSQLADDLLRLLDLLHLPRCAVLGYGYGGIVAQQLAAAAPARVERLALVCTPLHLSRSLGERVASVARGATARLLGNASAGIVAPELSSSEQADSHTQAAARLLLQCDSRPWLGNVSSPTLVVAGERDAVATPMHAAELVRRLPNATLRTLPEAGHGLLATHSEALASELLPWLAAE